MSFVFLIGLTTVTHAQSIYDSLGHYQGRVDNNGIVTNSLGHYQGRIGR